MGPTSKLVSLNLNQPIIGNPGADQGQFFLNNQAFKYNVNQTN